MQTTLVSDRPAPAAPARRLGRLRRMFGGIRLQYLLFIAFTAVAALPVGILDYWQARTTLANEIDSVRERHLLVARNLTSTLSRYVIDVKSAFEVALASDHLDQVVPGLNTLLVSLDFNHICVIRADGSIEGALPGLKEGATIALDAKLLAELRALAAQPAQPALSNVARDPAGKPVLYLVKSLPNGRIGLGVISTDYLVRLGRQIAFGDRGHAVITDPTGRVIAHPFPDWIAKSFDISSIPIVGAMMRGQTGVMQFFSLAFQDDMIAGYSSVPEAHWGVMVPQPMGELKRRAREIDTSATIIALAAFAAAALISWGIARFIAGPVRRVATTADRILAGDESATVPRFRGLVPREIRRLGEAFNTMVDGLQRRNADTRRALAQAEQANAAKSQFLANMSHEIRTPLNGVLGMVELLKQTELSERQQRYAETATRSGTSLLGLINDILDLSKIEAGKLDLVHQAFDLGQMLHETVDLFAEAASAKGLTLDLTLPDALATTLVGDPYRLRQVFVNLIGNAIKFTQSGGVFIRAELAETTAATLLVRFEIRDTGIGIAADTQAMIFDDFVQANGSTTREFGGTGLGLSIARRIVTMMDGALTVQSSLGAGSVFAFTTRLAKPLPGVAAIKLTDLAPRPSTAERPPLPALAPAVTPAIRNGLPAVRVLLVEDNALNMELAKAMLRGLGCAITTAVDGEEAVVAYQANRFDLVLMDLQMPKMDGFAATAAIRDIQVKTGERTPILALTAHALAGDRARSLAAGFDEHLTKPITFAVLKGAVTTWATPDRPAPIQDPPAEARVIDAAAIERLREVESSGNDGLVHRVLTQFLSVGEALVGQMASAAASGDDAGIRQAAHTLKSNSAYLGAERLRARCVAVEAAMAQTPPAPVTALVEDIRIEYGRATGALLEILGEPAAG